MNTIILLWKIYSYVGSLIAKNSRTGNVVGEFTEELMADFHNATLAKPSTKAFDFQVNGIRYQVKSRMANKNNNITGNLSDIHYWDFDILVVVFYDKSGSIKLVKEFTMNIAQQMANNSKNGNRSTIPVSKISSSCNCNDITNAVKNKYGL